MAYDVYCYQPISEVPKADEALQIMAEDESRFKDLSPSKYQNPEIKQKIAAALIAHNPGLEAAKFDFKVLAEFEKITEDQARLRWNYIELNTKPGELAFQITICDKTVQIAIPYWYQGAKAAQAFSLLAEYLRIIRRVAGYFVYDPQTKLAFDPLKTDPDGIFLYDMTTRNIPRMIEDAQGKKKDAPKGSNP